MELGEYRTDLGEWGRVNHKSRVSPRSCGGLGF